MGRYIFRRGAYRRGFRVSRDCRRSGEHSESFVLYLSHPVLGFIGQWIGPAERLNP